MRSSATELAHRLVWLPSESSSRVLFARHGALSKKLEQLLRALEKRSRKEGISEDFRWLDDNVRLVNSEVENVGESFKRFRKLPHVRTPDGAIVPRVLVLAESFLSAAAYCFSEISFTAYFEAFERETVLKLDELWILVPVLKLALLEQIAARASQLMEHPDGSYGVAACVRSLREVGETSWKDLMEPLIGFDRILREDPSGDYPRMDFDSRDFYRTALAKIAKHSDFTESQVATEAIALAREAQQRGPAGSRQVAALLACRILSCCRRKHCAPPEGGI